MGFVFMVFLASYFALVFGYKNFVQSQIAKREKELADLASAVPKAEQDEFLKFQYQVINLQKILGKHTGFSKILALLEANTNTQVFYKGLDVNINERRANINLVAQSYEVLAQQIQTFAKMPEVTRYEMTEARLAEGGRVQSAVSLFLAPEVFKP